MRPIKIVKNKQGHRDKFFEPSLNCRFAFDASKPSEVGDEIPKMLDDHIFRRESLAHVCADGGLASFGPAREPKALRLLLIADCCAESIDLHRDWLANLRKGGCSETQRSAAPQIAGTHAVYGLSLCPIFTAATRTVLSIRRFDPEISFAELAGLRASFASL
jgi:hypothetical protein